MFRVSNETRFLIRKALREDIGKGDVTTEALVPSHLMGTARIEAKEAGVLCGGPVVKEVFRLMNPRLKFDGRISDGAHVSKGKEVLVIRGRMVSILKAERVALNFLGRLSGIATLTHEFVRRVRETRAQIFDTRKTTPLWRQLEKYAVRVGGGRNHRFGLWDEILVKDNHWLAIRKLLEKTRCRYFGERLRSQLRKRKIPVEIEVGSLKELSHLLEGDFIPDRVLFDNFSIGDLKRAIHFARSVWPKVALEASGGVTLANVRQVAETGVDRISIGTLTHSAPALDFSLTISRVQ